MFQNIGWESEALVFFNRLLDIAEGIEEVESGGPTPLLDSTDLALTDFPLDAPLPASSCVSHAALEEAREWLLAVSMDQRIDQVIYSCCVLKSSYLFKVRGNFKRRHRFF
jgi:intraflagellar transport protein 172